MSRIKLLDLLNESPDQKDIKRIRDLIKKANGDLQKQIQLARTMAKKITGEPKAQRRAEAAERLLGKSHEVTKIFLNRTKELGKAGGKVMAPQLKKKAGMLVDKILKVVRKNTSLVITTSNPVLKGPINIEAYLQGHWFVIVVDGPFGTSESDVDKVFSKKGLPSTKELKKYFKLDYDDVADNKKDRITYLFKFDLNY